MASSRARTELIGLSLLAIDRTSEETLRRQLFLRLRDAIAHGELRAGMRIPSTRAVAETLSVSRNTVADVFAQLIADGYLVTRHGAGTYVAANQLAVAETATQTSWERASMRGRLLTNAAIADRTLEKPARAFQVGVPPLDHFPFESWSRIAARIMRQPSLELVSYGDPAGYRPLREAIAAQVRSRTGIACRNEQIVIVGGSQQALDLVCRLALDPGDAVWLEDPSSLAVRACFLTAGATLVAVPVDEEGIDVEFGRAIAPKARLVHVTSASQWPLGPAMSRPRREALLEWASVADAWVVEEEYDGAFRYDDERPSYLKQLDTEGRVIWVGSFSITTFPAIRLGYVIAPPELVDAFVAAKATADRQTSTFEQAILAEFMYQGQYQRHLQRMREIYAERRAHLMQALRERIDLPVRCGAGGLHVTLLLPDGVDDVAITARARDAGVSVSPLSRHYAEPRAGTHGLLLGFGVADAASIDRGIGILARLLDRREPLPRAARDLPG